MTDDQLLEVQEKDNSLKLQDLWAMFIARWYWFVISLIVTMAIGVYYIMSSPDVYTRTCSVLMKDADSKGQGGAALNDFADLDIFKSKSNIYNEMEAFQSPTLMRGVVERLKLNESYSMKDGLKPVELYKHNPFTVTISGKKERTLSFEADITGDKTYSLSSLVVDGEEISGTFEGELGHPLQTPVGTIALLSTNTPLKNYEGQTISYARGTVDGAAKTYASSLGVENTNAESDIIDLTIASTSIQKADDILNTLIDVYNENWMEDRSKMAISASQFISERLAVIERELGQVDDNISNFKSRNLMPDVAAAAGMYLEQSAQNKKDLVKLENELGAAQYIRKALSSKNINQPLPMSSVIESSSLSSQITSYNEKVLSRNQLLSNSNGDNPLVKDLTAALNAAQDIIIQSVDNYIIALQGQIHSVNKEEAAANSQLASSPDQEKYLLSVQRQQSVKEQLYIYLLQKREENELSQAFSAYNTRVIKAPMGSSVPTSPQKNRILMIAFAIGLVIPAGLIFLKEATNHTVRGRSDLESMKVPFLGELPFYGKKNREWPWQKNKKSPVPERVVVPHSRDMINEAFRVLRTNLEFMASAGEQKVIMFTSFNPGSGKTFSSLNLATSFVIKDRKTVVLDLDFRRATLSRFAGKAKSGISNYLNEQMNDWHEILVAGDANTPDILPVGTLPPNPAELLSTHRLEELLTELRKEYDYIVLDCPPVELVADTTIVAKHADMTIFVARAGLMERDMVPVIDEYYTSGKLRNMSLLLNGTSTLYVNVKGYHRYNYRYGYNYGYGHYYSQK